MKITKANIMDHVAELEALGFKRWQKNGMDRMYIDARKLGLDVDTQTFKGERISGRLCREMADAKTYIDLTTGMIVSTKCDLTYEAAVVIGIDPVGGKTKIQID